MPKSPWIASAACINTAGVPVEFIVATIFSAIIALLPMPVIIRRPEEAKTALAALANDSSTSVSSVATACASMLTTDLAKDIMSLKLSKMKNILCKVNVF